MNRTARTLAPLLLLLAIGATACASGDGDGGDSSNSSEDNPAAISPRDATGADLSADDGGALAFDAEGEVAAEDAPAPDEEGAADPVVAVDFERALIKQGNIALRSGDVTQARIEVQKIVDRFAGRVSEEETQADQDGASAYTRMVLRIPTADFSKAMAALEKVDKVESSSSNEQDVTAQVIDVQTRVQAQKRSIARITVLFDQASNIRDIMAIESELSRRQADLEALERKQAQLASQTSMSTIVVSIEGEADKKTSPGKDDDDGFLSGLSAGWDALKSFGTGLATVVGALLPWTIVGAVVGVPTFLLVRSLRRRTAPVVPEEPQASE